MTLFASGDSSAQVPLEAGFPQALRLAGLEELGPAYHLPMLSEVYDRADEFDLIHSHLEHLGFPFARLAVVPTISTMHRRVDLEDFKPIYDRYADLPLVSSSQSQSDLLPDMNWVDTVYHGLPPTSFHVIRTLADTWLFWAGYRPIRVRRSRSKRLDAPGFL